MMGSGLPVPHLRRPQIPGNASAQPTKHSFPHTINPKQVNPNPVEKLLLQKDQVFRIEYVSGDWKCAPDGEVTGLEGIETEDPDLENFLVGDNRLCSLVGRTGGGVGKNGEENEWKEMPPMTDLKADNAGPLQLAANDIIPARCPACRSYQDNEGKIDVIVTIR